jgi:hypothetical protein
MSINIETSVGHNGANKAADVRAVKTRLVELGFDWLGTVGDINEADQVTISTIKLFQAIINGLNVVNHPSNDGRIDPGGNTIRWLQASNAPKWIKMPVGSREEGFLNTEVLDASDKHDFGTDWLSDTLRAAGAEYKQRFLSINPDSALLTINDTSLPRGGNTPAHATHESGLACDIRLPRKDGGVGGVIVTSSTYDRNTMRAILKAFLAQPLAKRILLNDAVLIGEELCRHAPGHADHAHFEIKPPARQP